MINLQEEKAVMIKYCACGNECASLKTWKKLLKAMLEARYVGFRLFQF